MMKHRKAAFLSVIPILALTMPAVAQSEVFPVGQGGVSIIGLSAEQCGGRIEVFGKRFECLPDRTVIIGADIAQEPGIYQLTINGVPECHISVQRSEWPVEYWSKRPGRPAPRKQREREAARIQYAQTLGEQKYFMKKFVPPTSYPLQGLPHTQFNFGTRRMYKNPRTSKIIGESQHRGEDFPTGKRAVPIQSIAGGVVVLADRFSAEGNLVIVYHGSGVYSLSMHLSKISVREGDYVNAGDVLGLSGDTGSAKGIHLHLTVKVNGTAVNPLQFIELFK